MVVKNNRKFFGVRLFLSLAVLLGGFLFLRNSFFASANDGDFNEAVKGSLTLRKTENGVEKITYLSGEDIVFDGKIEISGDETQFTNSYVLYKLPAKYLGSVSVNAPSFAAGSENYTEGDYRVWKVKYSSLSGGSVAGTIINVRLKNPQTPDGYSMGIVQEFYSESNELLSKKQRLSKTKKLKGGYIAPLRARGMAVLTTGGAPLKFLLLLIPIVLIP